MRTSVLLGLLLTSACTAATIDTAAQRTEATVRGVAVPELDGSGAESTVAGTTVGTSALVSTGGSAIDLLAALPIVDEHRTGYDRALFPHWSDDDGDGCSTRHEVLQRESLTVAHIDMYRCFVVGGDWYSVYDGVSVDDPSRLEVDHVVALAEAWDSGAWAWSGTRRERFANDLGDVRALRAVTSATNRSKSDRDPADWMPPLVSYHCTYLADWIAIKVRWSLSVDPREHSFLAAQLAGPCAGTEVASVDVIPLEG